MIRKVHVVPIVSAVVEGLVLHLIRHLGTAEHLSQLEETVALVFLEHLLLVLYHLIGQQLHLPIGFIFHFSIVALLSLVDVTCLSLGLFLAVDIGMHSLVGRRTDNVVLWVNHLVCWGEPERKPLAAVDGELQPRLLGLFAVKGIHACGPFAPTLENVSVVLVRHGAVQRDKAVAKMLADIHHAVSLSGIRDNKLHLVFLSLRHWHKHCKQQ